MEALKTLRLFIAPLEESGISYFITGSTASIYYGEPRLTLDIDVVIHLSQDEIPKLVALFPEDHYYCPPPEVIQIECHRRSHGHFNLIHPASGFKADIYPASSDPLHHWAFANRRREDVGDGSKIWLAPPEYVIIRKLEYFREGGSEKHLEDIGKMLPEVSRELNHAFLENEISVRGLGSMWDRARLFTAKGD
jgi:hypothetical protein